MDMHNIVSKLVTYSTLGLVRDKSRKSKDDKSNAAPADRRGANTDPLPSSSCWPSKQQLQQYQQQQQQKQQHYQQPDIVNRAEIRRTGNLEKISALQALRGGAQPYYYRTSNTVYQNNIANIPSLFTPDVVRHGSISLSDDYMLAEGLLTGLLRTVCI